MNQYTIPYFLPDADGGNAVALERLPFGGAAVARGYDERWLQDLLFGNPKLIPAGDIDPAFKNLIPLCQELPTQAGPIDLVFVTPDGGIVLVETKLWQNPEARREVVVQILDYAKELSQWGYEDFCQKSKSRLMDRAGSVFELVSKQYPETEEGKFSDAVGRCLRSGRFLLLIVGDGIKEGVENLTDFLDRLGRLQFTFGLIEVGIYVLNGHGRFVQPRVLAKTMIFKRSVIEIASDQRVRVIDEGEAQEEKLESALDPRGDFYWSFWTEFIEKHLKLDNPAQPPARPNRSANIYFSLPPSGSEAWISAYIAQSSRTAGVYLRFAKGTFGDEAYRRLQEDRPQIDEALGIPVEWQEHRTGKHSVAIRMKYTSLDDPKEVARVREFFAQAINRFVDVFRPRLEQIAKTI